MLPGLGFEAPLTSLFPHAWRKENEEGDRQGEGEGEGQGEGQVSLEAAVTFSLLPLLSPELLLLDSLEAEALSLRPVLKDLLH